MSIGLCFYAANSLSQVRPAGHKMSIEIISPQIIAII